MMKRLFLAIHKWGMMLALVMALALALVSCIVPPPNSAQEPVDSVNIAQQANLHQTSKLEILALTANSIGDYTLVAQVDDPALITKIVTTLDQGLPLLPALRCIDHYRLRFILADGIIHEFGYLCQDDHAYLQGGPGFLEGHAVEPPSTLLEIVREQVKE